MKVLDLLREVQGSVKDASERYERLIFCFSIAQLEVQFRIAKEVRGD